MDRKTHEMFIVDRVNKFKFPKFMVDIYFPTDDRICARNLIAYLASIINYFADGKLLTWFKAPVNIVFKEKQVVFLALLFMQINVIQKLKSILH